MSNLTFGKLKVTPSNTVERKWFLFSHPCLPISVPAEICTWRPGWRSGVIYNSYIHLSEEFFPGGIEKYLHTDSPGCYHLQNIINMAGGTTFSETRSGIGRSIVIGNDYNHSGQESFFIASEVNEKLILCDLAQTINELIDHFHPLSREAV